MFVRCLILILSSTAIHMLGAGRGGGGGREGASR